MAPNSDFKPQSQSFNPFTVNEELQNNELDPDINYYLDQISSMYLPGELKNQLKRLQLNSFSVFHLNLEA